MCAHLYVCAARVTCPCEHSVLPACPRPLGGAGDCAGKAGRAPTARRQRPARYQTQRRLRPRTDHTRSVPSWEADSTQRPSWLQHTLLTALS